MSSVFSVSHALPVSLFFLPLDPVTSFLPFVISHVGFLRSRCPSCNIYSVPARGFCSAISDPSFAIGLSTQITRLQSPQRRRIEYSKFGLQLLLPPHHRTISVMQESTVIQLFIISQCSSLIEHLVTSPEPSSTSSHHLTLADQLSVEL